MAGSIVFDVIGNTGPFSLVGESSGYAVSVNGHRYLLECGASVFPFLGFHGVAGLKGIFATHSHEDHRRWFTDIVLFTYYDAKVKHKTKLISSEPILEEFHKNSKGALERSLSDDSKRIVDIPYEDMVEEVLIGPRSKFFISYESDEQGRSYCVVKDRTGNIIGPEKAKIFINPKANRPRLLYKDDESGEWVEPESYYPFRSSIFYEDQKNDFVDDDAELVVKVTKSSAWHGVPTMAYQFITPKESLFFSADTVYNPRLWKELCETYRPQNFKKIDRETFESQSIIHGDINNFIERTWSRERYEAAISAYEGSVIIHDLARANSVVHTDYVNIGEEKIENLIFTHNPDNITAWRPILRSGKRVVVKGDHIYEAANGKLYPFDADVYVRHFSSNLVGYKSKNGPYKVIKKNGLLGVVDLDHPGEVLMRVDLYVEFDGEYYPMLEDPDKHYRQRPDGKVEVMTSDEKSSQGIVVEGVRGKIKSK